MTSSTGPTEQHGQFQHSLILPSFLLWSLPLLYLARTLVAFFASGVQSKPTTMAIIQDWLPPTRENWEWIVWLWQFFPLLTAVQWLTPFYPQGKTSITSRFNIPGALAWTLMEIPGVSIVLYLMWQLPPTISPPTALSKGLTAWDLPWGNWAMAGMYTIHYLYRAVLSPLLLNPSMSPIHPLVLCAAAAWQIVNGISLGGWLAGYGPTSSWDWTGRLVPINLGLIIWGFGLLGNMWHDDELREIRRAVLRSQKEQAAKKREQDGKPSDAKVGVDKVYMLPKNGLFRIVLYPHYLCEWIEWAGFWMVGGMACVPARSFLLNEISAMVPRAQTGRQWYIERFGRDKLTDAKGSEETFHDFPGQLKRLVEAASPQVEVTPIIYPRYETKGELPTCSRDLREWLVYQVLLAEKEVGNSNPRENPTVGVILVGHSMGGFVAADALLSLMGDWSPKSNEGKPTFPMVKGLLAFDTPYCGLSRLMFAYGAFAQYKSISGAYGFLTSLSAASLPSRLLSGRSTTRRPATASAPAWKAWQLVALRTGTAGAIAAAGAAAYMHREKIARGWNAFTYSNVRDTLSGVSILNIEQGLAFIGRENISLGWAWLSSHLQFVSSLTRGEEMKTRIERLSAMKGIGFANLYGSLGENSAWTGGRFVAERTFVAVPTEKAKASQFFVKIVNRAVKDEIQSHVSMFAPEKNNGFKEMAQHAAELIVSWNQIHDGHVEDLYTPNDGSNVEQEASKTRKKDEWSNLTRYTYSLQTGLTEASPQTQKVEQTWSLGRYAPSMPLMPSLPRSMPSLWQTMPSSKEDAAKLDKPAITRYFWSEKSGLVSDDDTHLAASDVQQGELQAEAQEQLEQADAAAISLPRQDTEEQEALEAPNEVPGVTEDLQLDEY
ncbi:hypothetical protein FH972_025998 [Carpinus fangiana]|uniref:3-oxo-5-alpha-steroid 4-dehydrogenase C-terminal domain-containing protein n=1 Tax=Carpinus fangiana TaxID=176857 RepID=A0A5N6L373_9ROSI|nr:hypothetical protein FH972_025998 [Carpinus fangiana]